MMAQVRSFPHRDVPRSPDAAHLWGIILAGPAGPLRTDFGRNRLARLGRRARLDTGDDVFGETLRRASRLIADDRLVDSKPAVDDVEVDCFSGHDVHDRRREDVVAGNDVDLARSPRRTGR